MWVLDLIFGPNAAGNPYYDLYSDAFALIPWWYPVFIGTIVAATLLRRWYKKARYRRATVNAANRVLERLSLQAQPATPWTGDTVGVAAESGAGCSAPRPT